jgi:hypothetical protein
MNEKPNTQYITSYSTLMGMLTKAKIRWLLPKDNFVKLINTDGACKDQRVACCVELFVEVKGEWIGGFAKCVDLCCAFVAEVWGWGVLVGPCYIRSLGFNKVELNVDSKVVV